MRKRVGIRALALILVLTLVGCGTNPSGNISIAESSDSVSSEDLSTTASIVSESDGSLISVC